MIRADNSTMIPQNDHLIDLPTIDIDKFLLHFDKKYIILKFIR